MRVNLGALFLCTVRIAVIPARGGSKRIPNKNVREFCGLPIIAWSIIEAQKSGCFDRVLVSTDSPEIAEVASSFGAEAPFVRPAHLADDHCGVTPVVAHAARWQAAHGTSPNEVCCIFATAPFIQGADIRRGLEVLHSARAEFAFAVTTFPFPIQRALRITGEERVEMLQPEHFNSRSQDLEIAFHDAAQFYWGRARAWTDELTMFASAAAPVRIPRFRVQDIDTEEDWERAEWLFRSWRSDGMKNA